MTSGVAALRTAGRARGWAGAILAAVLGAALALSTGVPPAAAHAVLLETSIEDGAVLETAPADVELRFNERVQLVGDAMRLFPAEGDALPLTARVIDTTVAIELPPHLDDGAYALSYRVVSGDGHPVGGAIAFQIGEGDFPTASVAVAASDPAVTDRTVAVLTGVQILGLLLLVGLLLFELVALRSVRPPGTRTTRLLRIAAATAAVAAVVLIPVSGVRVTGRELIGVLPDGSPTVLDPETWVPGLSWQPVIAASAIVLAGLAALPVATRAPGRTGRVVAALLALIALAAPLLVGHSQTAQPGWVMLAADFAHLLTAAYWVGGVVGLLLVLTAASWTRVGAEHAPQQHASPEHADRATSPEDAALVVARFSRGAGVSILLLIGSGIVMAVLILDTWAALAGTTYGLTLLLKLGVVAALLPLAAWNRTRLLPRIRRRPTEQEQWASLRRILAYEAALLVIVIAVTGFLSTSSPNVLGGATGAPVTAGTGSGDPDRVVGTAPHLPLYADSQGLTVDGLLAPGVAGANTVTLRLEYEGEPLTVDDVQLAARLPDQALGPFTATPERTGEPGEYTARLTLPVAGDWQLQVSARIDTFTQPIAIIPIAIHPSP